jgi:UDP-N-acetyl-2-amino-2-deoxyglucuronate dehydrogenase
MRTASKVRFAVVGAGVIGDVHARAIRSLPEAAAGWSTDYQAVLAGPGIDAVSICTPSGTHADLAVAALQSGKHVMVEKPIDVSLEAADRILAAERASGRKVAVVSQHRFDPSTEQVIAAIQPATWDG